MLRNAMRVATHSTHRLFRHGVAVEKGGALVATGYNHSETHAEVMAVSKLWPSKRRGTTVWSIRITRSGKLANACPCGACMAFLKKNGVKKVIYSTSERTLETARL